MTNAVFDISNMFFRSLFIVGGYGTKQYTFDNKSELDQLMRKVTTDVSQVIRQLNPSRVLFAMDSRSWRKDIPIDENEGYKGQRTKAAHINWDKVFEIMTDFSEIMENNGFIISCIEGAEADDLMALWRDELLYKQNQHVILVSADKDVKQLVDSFEVSGKIYFSTVFNPFTQGKNSSKKLFVPTNFINWLEDSDIGDIFDRSIDVDKEDFKKIADDSKIKVEVVDGIEVAMNKIFCGDDGDNVPAIYTWLVKDKNGEDKEVRITDSKYKKIVETVGVKRPQDLLNKKDLIFEQIEKIAGHKPSFNIEERIKRQMKLVVLDKNLFPRDIVKLFSEKIKEELDKSNIRPHSINMVSLLEGTKYIDPSYKKSGKEASIFGEMDRINLNKSLF